MSSCAAIDQAAAQPTAGSHCHGAPASPRDWFVDTAPHIVHPHARVLLIVPPAVDTAPDPPPPTAARDGLDAGPATATVRPDSPEYASIMFETRAQGLRESNRLLHEQVGWGLVGMREGESGARALTPGLQIRALRAQFLDDDPSPGGHEGSDERGDGRR